MPTRGRTSRFVPLENLEERFDATAVADVAPRYNVAPEEDLAVVTNDADETALYNWSLVPFWADDPDDTSRLIGEHVHVLRERRRSTKRVADRLHYLDATEAPFALAAALINTCIQDVVVLRSSKCSSAPRSNMATCN